jgi:hypothetical protein
MDDTQMILARLAALEASVNTHQPTPVSIDDIDAAIVAARKNDTAVLHRLEAAVNELRAQLPSLVTKSTLDHRIAGLHDTMVQVMGEVSADSLDVAKRETEDSVRAVKRIAERAEDASRANVKTAAALLQNYASELGA